MEGGRVRSQTLYLLKITAMVVNNLNKKEENFCMKKVLILLLSAVLVFGFATLTIAATIATSGEIDAEYFNRLWTGEQVNYTLLEAGLNNKITINDNVEANLNFWLESDEMDVQNYNIVDDAYVTYKFGANSLLIGKTRYWQLQGPLDSLQGFFRGLLGNDHILEPAVSVIDSYKLTNNLNLTAGYLFNVTDNVYSDYKNNGINMPFIKASYSAGSMSADLEYIQPTYAGTAASWYSQDPAADYMLDVTYKLNSKFTVWAAYLGVDQVIDNNTIARASVDKTDNFGLVGFTASIGNLWASVDYAVSAPESSNWITYSYQDTPTATDHETDWSKDKPFGVNISYYLGSNTTLMYTYATNTGVWQDKSRLRFKVTF
jgi:hypothetical protein